MDHRELSAEMLGVCELVVEGNCSLRAAITTANSDGRSDTIEIPAGSYQLTAAAGGELSISASMTLAGAGARSSTIVAAPSSRILNITAGNVGIDDLTLTGASFNSDGGAMLVAGTAAVTIERDTLSNNDVLVVANRSGGAIEDQSSGQLLIDSSTFSGNRGYNGGALNSSAPARIVNSTFFGNHAGSSSFNGDGGAMQVSNAVLVNDTISGNECFNGSGCGGGVIGTMQAADTIIAGNTDNSASVDNCSATIAITGPDLENGSSCNFATGGSKQANPLLGPLAANGGPTDTMLPGTGSPALNAGTNATCASHDQRGGGRPAPGGGPCDIGAVEVNSLADVSITGTVSPGSVQVGRGVVYTLTARNTGPDPALGVTIQNLLPAGASFAGAIASVGSCSGSTTLTCSVGTLAAGGSATVNVSATLGAVGTATDVAAANAPATDVTPTDNQTSIAVDVLAAPPPVRPVLSAVSISPGHFHVTAGRKRHHARLGATIRFKLNEPALVTIVIQRKLSGRLQRTRCLINTHRPQHGRRCTVLLHAETMRVSGASGNNRVAFSGRIGKTALPAGSYLATLVATTHAMASKRAIVVFTVAR